MRPPNKQADTLLPTPNGEEAKKALRCLGWAVTASRWQLQVELPGKQVDHGFEVSH